MRDDIPRTSKVLNIPENDTAHLLMLKNGNKHDRDRGTLCRIGDVISSSGSIPICYIRGIGWKGEAAEIFSCPIRSVAETEWPVADLS